MIEYFPKQLMDNPDPYKLFYMLIESDTHHRILSVSKSDVAALSEKYVFVDMVTDTYPGFKLK